MSTLDDIKAAVREVREIRRKPTRGRSLYELNLWLGQQRAALNEEYQRRRNEIEASEEPTVEDEVSPKVLALVAEAVAEGLSRSNLRRALGKSTLAEVDEVIAMATGALQERVAAGDLLYTLKPDGKVHAKGWPLYTVTLLATGESHSGIHLITSARTTEVGRQHLRISPSPAGSDEILDSIWESGAAGEIFALGKE